MVIGVDRLDYSKGLPERFRAFETLLERHPGNRRQLVFLQIARRRAPACAPTRKSAMSWSRPPGTSTAASPSRTGRRSATSTAACRDKLLMGFFRVARIGLVTPMRDGMNLVAKEFVAAQDPADPGVLVLSRLAGAAAELGDGALLVNPYDPVGVADAILRAAEMPPQERREKHAAMMQVLRKNDIHAWRRRFVDALGG